MTINEILASRPVVPLVQADDPAVAVKTSEALARGVAAGSANALTVSAASLDGCTVFSATVSPSRPITVYTIWQPGISGVTRPSPLMPSTDPWDSAPCF